MIHSHTRYDYDSCADEDDDAYHHEGVDDGEEMYDEGADDEDVDGVDYYDHDEDDD